MTSAAVFVTWGTVDVPNYTKYYINQLPGWFDEVYVVTNEDRPVDVHWFKERNIILKRYPNKSRDFEKHYYWMMEMGRHKVTSYSRLAMLNDCLVCYGPLDKLMNWTLTRHEDIVGINSSRFPTNHIQSYFLILRHSVLGKVWDHFDRTGVVTPLKEIDEYELKLCKLAATMMPMFPQGQRRGWDELFWLPFDEGIPLVKHQCIMPRKPVILKSWQQRINRLAHPDTKAWQYLPLLADKAYVHRSNTAGDAPHIVIRDDSRVVTVQQTHQEQRK